MRRIQTLVELRAALTEPRAAQKRVGLVPTMGNLHAGHLELVARAQQAADVVVVSLFVNPLQFGPNEDFSRYPRTLEADDVQLEAVGVDLLYAPEVGQIYPNGYPPAIAVRLSGHLAETLEGRLRPRHFDGVATVVNILFNQVQPGVTIKSKFVGVAEDRFVPIGRGPDDGNAPSGRQFAASDADRPGSHAPVHDQR